MIREGENFEDEEDTEKVNSRSISIIISIIFLIIFIIGILYYYKSDKKGGELPIIKADLTPFKIKPEDPGGMIVPNMDKTIYNNFTDNANEQPKVEKILPAPEKPLLLKSQLKKGPDSVDEEVDQSSKSELSRNRVEDSSPQIITDLLKNQNKSQSKKTILTEEIKEAKDLYISHKKSNSGIKILLGSYQSEKMAQEAWIHLKKKYSKQLNNMIPLIKIKEIEEKGKFYHLQAGYIANKNEARALCKQIASQGQNCFLVQE